MKVSKEKAAENRTALLQAAGHLFRQRGIDGVGVAEICKLAGLTHGALYAQFSSKQELAAQVLEQGFRESRARIDKLGGEQRVLLANYFDDYLSAQHRDDASGGCSIAALVCDVGRQDAGVGASFAGGYASGVATIAAALQHLAPEQREVRATAILSLLSGALAASRAVVATSRKQADQILAAARDAADRLVTA